MTKARIEAYEKAASGDFGPLQNVKSEADFDKARAVSWHCPAPHHTPTQIGRAHV